MQNYQNVALTNFAIVIFGRKPFSAFWHKWSPEITQKPPFRSADFRRFRQFCARVDSVGARLYFTGPKGGLQRRHTLKHENCRNGTFWHSCHLKSLKTPIWQISCTVAHFRCPQTKLDRVTGVRQLAHARNHENGRSGTFWAAVCCGKLPKLPKRQTCKNRETQGEIPLMKPKTGKNVLFGKFWSFRRAVVRVHRNLPKSPKCHFTKCRFNEFCYSDFRLNLPHLPPEITQNHQICQNGPKCSFSPNLPK